MPFGQLVIGPPGSGKTTYIHRMTQFYSIPQPHSPCFRDVAIVNLDPGNDTLPYSPDIDITELISLNSVMSGAFDDTKLGPNGAILYCLEYLEANIDWLLEKLKPLSSKYLLFDLPGQVELYSHHSSLRNIVLKLTNHRAETPIRLCTVHLVDAYHCTDPHKYISMLVLSLKSMLWLEQPHVNVLSKMDKIQSLGTLEFGLDYYTQVQDLDVLVNRTFEDSDSRFHLKFKKLSSAICDLVSDFGIVGFVPFCIDDKPSILQVARRIDKANGYVYHGLEQANDSIFQVAERWDAQDVFMRDIEDRYLQEGDILEHFEE